MKIHHYHPVTGEFKGTTDARPDPLDKGKFLMPANSTTKTPPAGQTGKARLFDIVTAKWTKITDHRGETWYRAHGESVVVDFLGDPAAQGLTSTEPAAPEPTASQVKAEAYRRIVTIAPEWKQRNMTAHGVALLSKLQDGGTLTAEEQAAKTANLAIWAQVEAIRARSDEIEAMTPIPADFNDDARWP